MNIHYVAQEKSGVTEISLAPHTKSKTRFGLVDGALVLGFVAAFLGLVFLLAK
jgi:hypothetical protein